MCLHRCTIGLGDTMQQLLPKGLFQRGNLVQFPKKSNAPMPQGNGIPLLYKSSTFIDNPPNTSECAWPSHAIHV